MGMRELPLHSTLMTAHLITPQRGHSLEHGATPGLQVHDHLTRLLNLLLLRSA